MPTKIQLRRGTAAQWTTANTILLSGEQGYETDTKKIKIGDGTTAWNSLGYVDDKFLSPNSASSIYLTQNSAASAYLLTSASSNYLFAGVASATYLTQINASAVYLTKNDAASAYLRTSASSNYLFAGVASATYLTSYNANMIYLRIDTASATYVPDAAFAAKGNILAGLGSGTFNNLPVGPNLSVLTADSSASAGIIWSVPTPPLDPFLLMGA